MESPITNKWQNQKIKKKFKNRSCRSRAKKAIHGYTKQIPNTMLRGWIRRKAHRNGKINKTVNRSTYDLSKLQYESVINYEYITYGDGYDDYNEYWLDNIYDPWLYSQTIKIQRKSKSNSPIPIEIKPVKTPSPKPPAVPKPQIVKPAPMPAPVPPKPQIVKPAPKPIVKPAPKPIVKPVPPKKTKFEDKEYKKTDEEEKAYTLLGEKYIEKISEIEPYAIYSSIENLADRSTYSSHKNDKADPTSENMKKIMKEIRKNLPKNLYTSINGSMFVRFDENNPRFLQVLLSGIDDTPYESGLFLFDIYLCDDYPMKPLMIKHISYGGSKCQANNGPGGFSPNLHRSSGKVCLSLLGTWSGPGWEAGKSNVYQVISTIMFMIFGATHPYYMEPSYGGWEGTIMGRKQHEKRVIEYDEEVMYHNAKYTILKTLREPYVGFEDVIKMHFKIKCEWIVKCIERWIGNDNYSHGFKEKMKGVLKEIKQEFEKL